MVIWCQTSGIYLMMHSTHFIYGYMASDIWYLFNNALNTFYLWLYGVGHMVKNHSDSEIGNLLPLNGLLFLISSKGSFICTIPQTGQHTPWPLLHQLWSTGWNTKSVHLEGLIQQPITT